ncbi:MAG: hypothetical protein WCE75_08080 [Terracidiphilus sp.]
MRPLPAAVLAAVAFSVLFALPAPVLGQPPGVLPPHRPSEHNGFVYQPQKGFFWDPSVIYANNRYYMFSMYGGESIWLATSDDGVHWSDYGVVLKSEGFKNNAVWKPYIARVGDRYILNHGAFSDRGTNNNLLRFYESSDLVHWKFLYEVPIDPKFYLQEGRWDHMYMIPRDDANRPAGYLGYVVADPIDHGGFGMMESADGVHYRPVKAPEMQASFQIPTLEVGGVRKIGTKYYFLGGNANHYGFSGYGVYTWVADSPTGPFHPDMEAYRLTGTSGIDGNTYIHVLAAFVKDSPENLVSDPLTFMATQGTDGHGVWFLPMRKAIVDAAGHLRLVYWNGNDRAKGEEVRIDPSQHTVVFPPGQTDSNLILRVAATGDSLAVHTDKEWRAFSWLDARKTRKGVVVLNQRFDLDEGIVVEGRVKATKLTPRTRDARKTYAGFYVEGMEKGPGTAILLEDGEPAWRESAIGRLTLDTDFHFDALDVTGRNCATVTGLDDGKEHSFRLWLRGGQVELYIDDLLMQSFFLLRPSGRIGFIAQESQAEFSQLKVYRMNFATYAPAKPQEPAK